MFESQQLLSAFLRSFLRNAGFVQENCARLFAFFSDFIRKYRFFELTWVSKGNLSGSKGIP